METRFIAAAALGAALALGCTRESSHGPVQWTASNPASPVGQTQAQAWSRATSTDAPEPAHEAPFVPDAARSPCATQPPTGVTNAQPPVPQPPTPRWPYDGVTLILEPAVP